MHGAGSGPWIYADWADAFSAMQVVAVDLHEGLDVASASHDDYANAVVAIASRSPVPVALCGWSMGGLVVLDCATAVAPHSVIVLEPSPPAEVQGYDGDVVPRDGVFDPEAAYGRFPAGIPARPESARARAGRKRGISVPSVPCRSLVVYGDEFRQERGESVAAFYGSDTLSFPGLDHWDLVTDPRVRTGIAAWLAGERAAPFVDG